MILQEKTKTEFIFEFEAAKTTQNVWCQCDYCGIEFVRQKYVIIRGYKVINKDCCSNKKCIKLKREESSFLIHGVKNAGGTAHSLEKTKTTNLKKYGINNPNALNEVKEKTKTTNLKKYGKEHYAQTEQFKTSLKETYDKKSDDEKVKIEEKRKSTNNELYGADYASSTPWFKEKVKETVQEKYDVDCVSKNEEVKEKIKQTNIEKYGHNSYLASNKNRENLKKYWLETLGVEYHLQSPECQENLKKIYLERYGVDHPLKSEEVKEKIKQTNIEKYGVNCPLQNEKVKNKSKETCLNVYGVDNASKSEEVKEKIKQTNIEKYGVDHYSKTPQFIEKYTKTCMGKYGVPTTLLLFDGIKKFGKTENKIKEWINSLGFNFEKDYSVLKTKELDMLDKETKIAIEYCGNYWHSDGCQSPKDKNYHYDKYKNCLAQNIRLITIFEDEWKLREKQCKDYLKSVLGIFDKKIFARKCEIKEISKEKAINFINENHIQGGNWLSLFCAGLFHDNVIVGVMTIGRHHRINDLNLAILSRLCFADGCQIVGGASKLFKFCLNWCKLNNFKKIISWSDNRWSNGHIYEVLGFELIKNSLPDYYYINHYKPLKRYTKQSKKKRTTKCPEGKTESEWVKENNFNKIWDCGKKRWVYNFS